ncbi:MAG: hypothetical protein AAGH68_03950 [Pseudomonadota bacterium]
MNSLDFGPMMATTYAELFPGDKSVNVTALRDPEAVMLTSACSPNHVFWTHLSLVDMTRPADLPLNADAPPEARAIMRAFSFTDRGRQVLPGMLKSLERRS